MFNGKHGMPSVNQASSRRLVILAKVDNLASAVENSRIWPLAIFLAIYFPLTAFLASRKLIWDDEFFTLYISRSGSMSEILKALATGADQHPPLFYFLVHQITAIFGPSHLSFRLAAIFGYGLFCICVFFLLRNRTSVLWATVGMFLPLVAVPAYYYATEARGYSLVLGFCSLALLSWQRAAVREMRLGWLCVLFSALAMAVASHYYAVLFLIPLCVGELTRTYLLKRIDAPVWLSFCGVAIPPFLFLSTIRDARHYSSHFWAIPYWSKIVEFYPTYLGTPTTIFLLGLLVYLISRLWLAPQSSGVHEADVAASPPPAWEIVTCIAIAAIPLFAMELAKRVTHGYVERYAIHALIGAVLIICYAGFHSARRSRIIPFFLAVMFLIFFGLQAVLLVRTNSIRLFGLIADMTFLAPHTGQPVALADATVFHQVSFYARREFQRNFAYLCDPDQSVRYLGQDTIDRGLLDLLPWFPLNAVERARYENEHSEFLAYGLVNEWNWITFFFTAPSYNSRVLARNGGRLLLRIERSAPISASPQPARYPAVRERLFDRMPTSGPSLCEEWFPGDSLCAAVGQKFAATNNQSNYLNPPSR